MCVSLEAFDWIPFIIYFIREVWGFRMKNLVPNLGEILEFKWDTNGISEFCLFWFQIWYVGNWNYILYVWLHIWYVGNYNYIWYVWLHILALVIIFISSVNVEFRESIKHIDNWDTALVSLALDSIISIHPFFIIIIFIIEGNISCNS